MPDSPARTTSTRLSNILEYDGDIMAALLAGDYDAVVNNCCCFDRMGGGFSYILKWHFPQIGTTSNTLPGSPKDRLGTVVVHTVDISSTSKTSRKELAIATAYTQYQPHPTNSCLCPCLKAAVSSCLRDINSQFRGKTVAVPLLGAGLGGLDWTVSRKLIGEELHDCSVVIYRSRYLTDTPSGFSDPIADNFITSYRMVSYPFLDCNTHKRSPQADWPP